MMTTMMMMIYQRGALSQVCESYSLYKSEDDDDDDDIKGCFFHRYVKVIRFIKYDDEEEEEEEDISKGGPSTDL